MLLWKAVCSTKLLAKVQLILASSSGTHFLRDPRMLMLDPMTLQFLNKCDLLQKKLARGVRVIDWIPTYHDRPNDAPSVAKCTWSFFPRFLLSFNCLY